MNSHQLNIRNPLALTPGGYTVDAEVRQFGKKGNTLKKYKFIGVFPTDIPQLMLIGVQTIRLKNLLLTYHTNGGNQ